MKRCERNGEPLKNVNGELIQDSLQYEKELEVGNVESKESRGLTIQFQVISDG